MNFHKVSAELQAHPGSRVELAARVALESGHMLAYYFRKGGLNHKVAGHDIKSEADTRSQQHIFDTIRKRFPDDKLIGEESNGGNPKGTFEWIVDPLDATVNFANGIPHFCNAIAGRQNGQIVFGFVFDPMREELFAAHRGHYAKLLYTKPADNIGVQDLRVSPQTDLRKAILNVGVPADSEGIEHSNSVFTRYTQDAHKVRSMGSAALDMAYVAAGRIHGYVERGPKIWDIAPGLLMVEMAGGTVVATPLADGAHDVAATNGHLNFPAPQAREVLRLERTPEGLSHTAGASLRRDR